MREGKRGGVITVAWETIRGRGWNSESPGKKKKERILKLFFAREERGSLAGERRTEEKKIRCRKRGVERRMIPPTRQGGRGGDGRLLYLIKRGGNVDYNLICCL